MCDICDWSLNAVPWKHLSIPIQLSLKSMRRKFYLSDCQTIKMLKRHHPLKSHTKSTSHKSLWNRIRVIYKWNYMNWHFIDLDLMSKIMAQQCFREDGGSENANLISVFRRQEHLQLDLVHLLSQLDVVQRRLQAVLCRTYVELRHSMNDVTWMDFGDGWCWPEDTRETWTVP